MTYYTSHRTRTFAEIFHTPHETDEAAQGKTDYNYFEWFYQNCGVPDRLLSGDDYTNYSLETIYFLLISQYANDFIRSSDENRFKLELMRLIFTYAPQWQRLMVLQDKMLALDDDELTAGHKTIYNHAMHPDTTPSDAQLTELQYIDDQNTTNYLRDKPDSYSRLIPLLDDRATADFLAKFKKLFIVITYPGDPLVYITEEDE